MLRLRQVMAGLSFMHDRRRLHQSLGPGSVLLNSVDEGCVIAASLNLLWLKYVVEILHLQPAAAAPEPGARRSALDSVDKGWVRSAL